MTSSPRNHVGSPVKGPDFFAREAEQARMWRDLQTDNLLLLAPRRVGKTSLMLRLQADAPRNDYRAVFFTVADISTELGFVRRMHEHVVSPTMLSRLQRSELGAVTLTKLGAGPISLELDTSAEERWQHLGDALILALQAQPESTLLLIDELPVFVLALLRADPKRARRFLNWFRAARQQAPDVRWVLAGSIGLDTVAELHNLTDTINDLCVAELGAFEPQIATDFVRSLSATHTLGLDASTCTYLVARTGWPIPFFLQLLFREVRNLVDDTRATPDHNTIDAAWEVLLTHSKRAYFDYWRERLHEELGQPRAAHAELVLTCASHSDSGARRSTLSQALAVSVPDPTERQAALRFLLNVLQTDGYLVQDNDRFRFRSPLLRERWSRHVA